MDSTNPRLNRSIQQSLYEMTLQYGQQVVVYKLQTADTDYTTGAKTATKSSFPVRKCIVLPSNDIRKFFQGTAYNKAGGQFSSKGGQGWDQSTRGFIFMGKDLPGYNWVKEDWIVYDGDRYDIKMIEKLEVASGWMIVCVKVVGAIPERDITVNPVSTIILDHDASEVE